jgi:hypothetical protein
MDRPQGPQVQSRCVNERSRSQTRQERGHRRSSALRPASRTKALTKGGRSGGYAVMAPS